MNAEPVTYELLRDTHERERKGNKLTKLPPGYYASGQEYLDRLRREYERAHGEDPGSTEMRLLQDEYQNARDSLVAVFDLRLRKVLLLAHTAAKGGTVDVEALTPEESELFKQLQATLDHARSAILKGARKGERRVLVRVLEDLPPVTGTDLKVYTMKREDIVTLPEDTAQILITRGKAVVVDVGKAAG